MRLDGLREGRGGRTEEKHLRTDGKKQSGRKEREEEAKCQHYFKKFCHKMDQKWVEGGKQIWCQGRGCFLR